MPSTKENNSFSYEILKYKQDNKAKNPKNWGNSNAYLFPTHTPLLGLGLRPNNPEVRTSKYFIRYLTR